VLSPQSSHLGFDGYYIKSHKNVENLCNAAESGHLSNTDGIAENTDQKRAIWP
jgi:hypothetical protein